ncbi:serine protease inhibitor Kazal-type 13 isoform X1 [Homo sapiens]|nr:serine protease inhibitor Kazal-type 13 isoform X1 [Homo sapiens]XP_054207738.1 serine protease inhibitor Kazal-type 13 isoform X1 [Homo sapiens]
MADAPPPTKLECPRSTSDCCAGSKNFKPVDLSLLGSVGMGPAEQDHLAPWLQPPFQPRCKMYIPLDPDYNADCPNVTAPVCASNGHTFQNECFFCVEQREFHYRIKFEKYGKCD